MNADEFVSSVRKGDLTFQITKVVLQAEGQKIRGQGTLRIVRDDFEINLEVGPKYEVPDPKRAIWKPADAWKLSGLIDGDLKFFCDQVSPSGKSSSWATGKRLRRIQRLHLDRINLVPAGFDALSKIRKDELLQRMPIEKKSKWPEVEFHAVLFDCEPVFLNAGTEIRRIAGSLNSAKEFRVQDKFKALCQHFALNYDKCLAKHLEAWSRKRNPFMHGNWKEDDSDFSDQALIAGAINIFVLKLMGYSGRMKFDGSAIEIEDRYKII